MNRLFLLILIQITIGNCFSQSKPETIVQVFFEEFQSQDTEQAIENLYKKNQGYIDANNLKENAAKLDQYIQVLGDFEGYELAEKLEYTSSFTALRYLVKYERQPIRFTFMFYRPSNTWVVYGFMFDDRFDSELLNK